MALQTEGAISINDIRTELEQASGSLDFLSNLAGFPRPNSMSDFYGYSLPASEGTLIFLATEGFESPEEACFYNLNPGTQNMYVQAFGEGMFLYLDADLQDQFGGGGERYWYINYDGVSYSAFIDVSGSASQLSTCKE